MSSYLDELEERWRREEEMWRWEDELANREKELKSREKELQKIKMEELQKIKMEEHKRREEELQKIKVRQLVEEELRKIKAEQLVEENLLERTRARKRVEDAVRLFHDTYGYMKEEEDKRKRLESDFTEEERKMFDEYYELEEKFVEPHLMKAFGNDILPVPGTYEKIIAHVEQMLLIPGSIDRCKEYLERKLRKPWHIEEHKAYKDFIDCFVEDVRNRQKKEDD